MLCLEAKAGAVRRNERQNRGLHLLAHPHQRGAARRTEPLVAVGDVGIDTEVGDAEWDIPDRVRAIDDDGRAKLHQHDHEYARRRWLRPCRWRLGLMHARLV